MKRNWWGWLAAVAAIALGCSSDLAKNDGGSAGKAGSASSAGSAASPGPSDDDDAAGSADAPGASGAGGSGNASPCGDDAGATYGAEAGFSSVGEGGEAGAVNMNESCVAGECIGSRANVASAWDFVCPVEYCAAQVMASDCGALPKGVLKTSVLECWDDHLVLFEISPTRRKACYYGSKQLDGPVSLFGATVWEDEAKFCDGRATKISGGSPKEINSCDGQPFVTVSCDLKHPDQNQPQDGSPPRACYNRFGHVCQICCDETPPDCSDKPENYPGYECTPNTRGDEAYCSCSCQAGDWQCAC